MQARKRIIFEKKFPYYGIALNEAAYEYFLENLNRHTAFNELMLKRVNRREELTD